MSLKRKRNKLEVAFVKKSNSNKNIIIALIITILIVFLVSMTLFQRNSSKKEGLIQSFTNDIIGMVDRGLSIPLKFVEGSVSSINNLFTTYQENDRLKKKIDEMEALQSENKNYKAENEQLKQQLGLNATLSNYEKVSASVINRSPDSWQNIIIINKGTNDGVKPNMPVMGSKGLIGRVLSANKMTAKVELLTSSNQNSNHFPAMVATQSGQMSYGLLESYDSKEEAFIVTQLTGSENVKVDDTVTTSGLGGNSPKGLLIGKVTKVKVNSFGLDKQVYVKPSASMYDFSAVTVIKRLAGSD